MNAMRRWYRDKGRYIILRILIVAIIVVPILQNLGVLPDFKERPDLVFILLGLVLLLIVEHLMDVHPGDSALGKVDIISPAQFNQRLTADLKALKTLDIMASSSESLFINFAEFLRNNNCRCRILLRNPAHGDDVQKMKLERYKVAWLNLVRDNPNLDIKVKFTNNTVFRLLILNNNLIYLSFYRWSGRKFFGHSISSLRIIPGHEIADYLRDMVLNRFEYAWEHAKDDVAWRTD